jgi:hypothetical protein
LELLVPHICQIWEVSHAFSGAIYGENCNNLLPSPTMQPASWLWDHFYKGNRVNSTQHKAFATITLNSRVQSTRFMSIQEAIQNSIQERNFG